MIPRSTVPDSAAQADPFEEKPTVPPHSTPNSPIDIVHKPEPRRGQDIDPETGQMRPISAAEWQARMEELTRRLAEIDAADDTPEEVYDEFMRNLDEERRRQGRPPAFEGCY